MAWDPHLLHQEVLEEFEQPDGEIELALEQKRAAERAANAARSRQARAEGRWKDPRNGERALNYYYQNRDEVLARRKAKRDEERKKMRPPAMREKLPADRPGKTLHFVIYSLVSEDRFDEEGSYVDDKVVEVDGYVQTGCYDDGRLGEIFVKVGKSGDAHAMLDQWAIAVSKELQYGVPVYEAFEKHLHTRFEPSGPTNVPGVPRCTSPVDLISRWVLLHYAPAIQEPIEEEKEGDGG